MTALQQAVDNDLAPEIVREETRAMADRRESAWSDPRLWVSVGAVALTIVLAVLGYIAALLSSISASVQTTRDAVIVVTTRQEKDSEALRERLVKVEAAVSTQEKAYNFNFTTRLAKVEAVLGIKSEKEN